MSRKAISVHVLRQVVADLGRVFTTKDVSEDIRMKQAHLDLVDHKQYHAFVGGALSDHRAQLEIDEIEKHTSRGSRWKKIGAPHKIGTRSQSVNFSDSVAKPTSQQTSRIKFSTITDIGPQFAGDNSLQRKMRKHQS